MSIEVSSTPDTKSFSQEEGTLTGHTPSPCNDSASKALDPSLRHFQIFVDQLHLYVLPIVIVIGLAGNSTSFIVFICTHLKRTSCNIYLAALAVSDSAFLICVLLSWGANIYNQNGWCQSLVYLTYITSFLSVWYVVAFTVERFILVCFPGYRPIICKPRTAKNVVISLGIFAIVMYLFSPFMSGVVQLPGQSFCLPLPGFSAAAWIINNIDTLITLIVPTVVILGCNIRIAHLVCTFYNKKDSGMAVHVWKWDFTSDNKGGSNVTSSKFVLQQGVPLSKGKPNYQMRATQMLLVVSTVFLICNIPSHVIRAYAFVKTMRENDYVPTKAYFVWQKFFQLIFYMNFSVNVFLYSFSSRSFRLGFRRLMLKIGKRVQNLIKRKRMALSPDMHYRSPLKKSDLLHGSSL